MRMIRGQMSPLYARALRDWHQDLRPGMIQLDVARDVLPPELLPHFDNLKPPPPAAEDQISITDHSKYGFFTNFPISVGLGSILVLPHAPTTRTFLFIVNTHATQTLFVRFGGDSSALIGVPIQPVFGFMAFDVVVPQDDVYMVGNGVATTGVGLFCNANN